MQKIEMNTYIQTNIEKVFEFHLNLNNLLTISPPEANLQIINMPDKLEEGSTVSLFVKMGPISTTMESVVDEIKPPVKLVDRQVSGFFSKWIHTHLFEKVSENMTKLTDIIEYSLPMGALGNLIGGGIAKQKIKEIFEHRAKMTKKLLEKQ